jgi:formate dehydrogenase subunit delta
MDMQNLIHMANKIGDFFETVPDHEESLLGIVGHIHNFWAPRMRAQLLEYVDTENGAGIKPLVLEAIHAYRSNLLPRN